MCMRQENRELQGIIEDLQREHEGALRDKAIISERLRSSTERFAVTYVSYPPHPT